MKRHIVKLTAIFSTLLLLILSGCHYHNINGDLDGQWQLMTIDETDGTQITPDRVYYCIQMHTINLTGGTGTTGNMQYNKEAKTLTLDLPLEAKLAKWGLPDSPCKVTFKIKNLSKEHLVMELEGNGRVLTFRKF